MFVISISFITNIKSIINKDDKATNYKNILNIKNLPTKSNKTNTP